MEETKRQPVVPPRPKVQYNFQARLAGPSESQTSCAGPNHGYYQIAKRPLLRSFVGERQNLNSSSGSLPVATHSLQKANSEHSYSRNMTAGDQWSAHLLLPLPLYVTGMDKCYQPQTLMEFHKAEVGPTRKLYKNMKETQVAQEQLKETGQLQEPKVLAQGEKSFLGCLVKNHNQHKKNQEKPQKGCAQECGETEKIKYTALGRTKQTKQTADLRFEDRKNQTNLLQPLQTVTRPKAWAEKSPNEQGILPMVLIEDTQTEAIHEAKARELSAKESNTYPAINRENQKLWRKLEQLAQDYYRVEESRKQLLKQKDLLKYQRWDSVIRGTSITLAEREHKQRYRNELDMFKTPVGLDQINLN